MAESTEKYQCEQCETDFDYKNENLMMKHYFEVHGTIPQKFENIPKYFCDHCPKLLTSEQARNLWIRGLLKGVFYKPSGNCIVAPNLGFLS